MYSNSTGVSKPCLFEAPGDGYTQTSSDFAGEDTAADRSRGQDAPDPWMSKARFTLQK